MANPQGDAEAALRLELQSTTWPAEIIRLADDYARLYPQSPWRPVADGMKQGAGEAVRALSRQDVGLYRSAFLDTGASNDERALDLRRAALGDKDAALRLARYWQRSGEGQTRYVGWLQYASTLGHERATYELALHFRRQDQPALASMYETRAVEMGFAPPAWLDHVRK